MGDFTQPQQKYAGTGENCNIAIPVIFYPVIKSLWKLLFVSQSLEFGSSFWPSGSADTNYVGTWVDLVRWW